MAQPKKELSQEAIRLRVEGRLSLREIAEVTGAAKGSLSGWLKPYPLTEEERRLRQEDREALHISKKRPGRSLQVLSSGCGAGNVPVGKG